jgi:hypothetical protein
LPPKFTKANSIVPLNQASAWKKSKLKFVGIKVLVVDGYLRKLGVDMWNIAAGDPWPLEKNPEEIPRFSLFCERGLSLPAPDFFRGLLEFYHVEHVHLIPMVSPTPRSSCTSVKLSWASTLIGQYSGRSPG